jgi:hypothetical protein
MSAGNTSVRGRVVFLYCFLAGFFGCDTSATVTTQEQRWTFYLERTS